MDFIKNNWGFLMLSIAGLVACTVCFILVLGAQSKLEKTRDDVQKVQSYLDSVAKKKIKLNQESITIAEKNSAEAAKGLKVLKDDLKGRFVLKYNVPAESTIAVRELKDEISAMQAMLLEKEIDFSTNSENFSMDGFITPGIILSKEDLGYIFKHLAVIKEVVNIAVNAKVQSIEQLERPMGLTIQEEGVYSFIPIEITIVAKPENAQKFINLMSQGNHLLFFLRSVEFSAPDVTTDIAKDIKVVGLEERGGMIGSRRGMLDDGGRRGSQDAGGVRRRGRGSQEPQNPGMDMMQRGFGGMPGNNDESGIIQETLKRQDLMAFEPKTCTWVLRFDYIEFPAPESDGNESDSDSAE